MRMSQPSGQTGPVTGKPFSANEVRRTTQTLADGSHIDQSETSSFARDEFGRMRIGNAKTIVIFDPVAGYTYTLDIASKSYFKTQLSGQETKYSIAVVGDRISTSSLSGKGTLTSALAAPEARVEENLPARVISGVSAKGARSTVTIPAGALGNNSDLKVINERWYSDDMQVLLKSSNADPRFGTTTYELTDLVQAPPDSSLFQVPGDYRFHAAHWQH
jgi:hypothetical protein